MKKILVVVVLLGGLIGFRFYQTKDLNKVFELPAAGAVLPQALAGNDTAKAYPKIPRDEILASKSQAAAALYKELQGRYKHYLQQLQASATAADARLVVVFLSPEFGNALTPAQRVGRPYIESLCQELKLPFVDLTQALKKAEPTTKLTQMPLDGHWSKAGAKVVADSLAEIVKAHQAHRSKVSYPAEARPRLLGDLEAKADKVLDGGKNLPYRLKTNAQGLRMDFELPFPKSKHRVLLMGDSAMYFPFLDNPDTGTALLQARFPDKEFANSANWGYSMEDYVTQFEEKAKYIEPDLIIVATNGNDILDEFFSHRNRFARVKREYQPTEVEVRFYKEVFESAAAK